MNDDLYSIGKYYEMNNECHVTFVRKAKYKSLAKHFDIVQKSFQIDRNINLKCQVIEILDDLNSIRVFSDEVMIIKNFTIFSDGRIVNSTGNSQKLPVEIGKVLSVYDGCPQYAGYCKVVPYSLYEISKERLYD